MEWDKHRRPPANVCPREFCFYWVVPGGMAATPGRVYESSQEMLMDWSNWKIYSEGACICPLGRCTRLDPVAGDRDFYESENPALEDAGLPWFYFHTTKNLHPEFREQF